MASHTTNESKNVLEIERRRLLLEAANAAYAKMREDPIASKAFDEETLEWDVTLFDGLEET
jgi:hypothetical protein